MILADNEDVGRLTQSIEVVLKEFESVPKTGLGAYLRVEACLIALVALEDICWKTDENPFPPLLAMISNILQFPRMFGGAVAHISDKDSKSALPDGAEHTADLFEAAWTLYDDKTYDHSVNLVEDRISRSGFDKNFFKGKVCLDGGCGTGRLSIAMAKAGAEKVVALDIGSESLEYLKRTCARYGLKNIEVVEHDVTDLSGFQSDSFDFVASNGVLHHTSDPDRGIIEHYRVTRPGGIFWIYLYGAGGFYWDAYDRLKGLVRDIEPRVIREILTRLQVRQGLIYTFLDNFLAPRVYYRLDQVLNLLRLFAACDYVHAKGGSAIDDTEKLLATKWGRSIFGPDGEIRIAVSKIAPHSKN